MIDDGFDPEPDEDDPPRYDPPCPLCRHPMSAHDEVVPPSRGACYDCAMFGGACA